MAAIPPTSSTPLAPPATNDELRRVANTLGADAGPLDGAESSTDYSAGMRGLDRRRGPVGPDAGSGTPLHALALAPVFGAPVAVAQAGAAKQSNVDKAVETLTTSNVDTAEAVALWKSLSSAEQRQVATRLIERHPAAAAEFANQLEQATDKTAAKEFWTTAEAWLTESVADTGYHRDRLPKARAFMDETAMLMGPESVMTKSRASRAVGNIQFSDEFGKLSDRARGSSVTEAARARAQLHMDTWKKDLRSGADPSVQAMARRDPAGFVGYLNGLSGDKKAYDAAVDGALKQPSIEFTGRGARGGHTTDPYMENLLDAVKAHGSPEVKADFALRSHQGGSLRPGFDDARAARRDLLADPKVLSIVLKQKSETFSVEMRDMIANDPARAQTIIAAGVAGFTAAYSAAMAKTPPDLVAAEAAAYELGLLLGETKEAATEAFAENPQEGYNFLKGIFTVVSKRLLGLVPGGNIAADVGKDVLAEISAHFSTQATQFKESDAPSKIDAAITKFVSGMFAAARDSFWTLRDPADLQGTVKKSPALDKLESEYTQFVKWLDAGYAAGRDGDNNATRSR